MTQNLIGLSKEELSKELARIGKKPLQAKQLRQRNYDRGETEVEKIGNMTKEQRAK